jgi:PPM family protein phosphatase
LNVSFHEGRLQKQTSDHSVPQLLANAGEIDASDIRFHEDRNRLLRSIGSEDTFKPHLEQSPITLYSGDAFLLCTDGFWEYVFEAEMVEYLQQASSAATWLNTMELRLLARAPERNDNYSAIAITML